MTNYAITIALMGGLCVLALAATPTPTNAGTAYLSHSSNGTCTQASPCSSMPQALAVAGLRGEVICLNKDTYGGAVVDQAVTISCGDGLWEANSPISVSTPAGSDVVIEGLVFDGTGNFGSFITTNGQGSLHLRNVRIGNFLGSSGNGLQFAPTGPATLHITDSVFYNNGGAGIMIQPTGAASTQVTIDRTHVESNSLGIVVDGTGSSGIINALIRDSVIAGTSGPGVAAKNSTVSLSRSHVVNNSSAVIANNGAAVLLGNSTIQGNGTAFAVAGGAVTFSYGNNEINANGTFGPAPTVIGLH